MCSFHSYSYSYSYLLVTTKYFQDDAMTVTHRQIVLLS